MQHVKFLVRGARVLFAMAALLRVGFGGTLATFNTSVGRMDLELFDEDKPITVSNFVKYVTSGRYTNIFIQRWEPNFVVQAGGYSVTNGQAAPRLVAVQSFGNIKNEYSVGRTFSNVYGTLAMARQGGVVDSAGSQWFLNLTNNAFLDTVDQGFTVFGKVTDGTNILNLFIPPPPTKGIYRVNVDGNALATVPVLTNVSTIDQLFTNLIYADISLRRDLNLNVNSTRPGQRRIGWTSIAGVTNILEYSTNPAANSWIVYTNLVGTGSTVSLIDTSSDPLRTYRVALKY